MENMQLTNQPQVNTTYYATSYTADLYGCTIKSVCLWLKWHLLAIKSFLFFTNNLHTYWMHLVIILLIVTMFTLNNVIIFFYQWSKSSNWYCYRPLFAIITFIWQLNICVLSRKTIVDITKNVCLTTCNLVRRLNKGYFNIVVRNVLLLKPSSSKVDRRLMMTYRTCSP